MLLNIDTIMAIMETANVSHVLMATSLATIAAAVIRMEMYHP